jgi:hypothetical protein
LLHHNHQPQTASEMGAKFRRRRFMFGDAGDPFWGMRGFDVHETEGT